MRKTQLIAEYTELKGQYLEAHQRIGELISGINELPKEEKIEKLLLTYPELDAIERYMDTVWVKLLEIKEKLS